MGRLVAADYLGRLPWEDYIWEIILQGLLLEDYFGRNIVWLIILGGIFLEEHFWVDYFWMIIIWGDYLGRIIWGYLFGGMIWGELFGEDYLVRLFGESYLGRLFGESYLVHIIWDAIFWTHYSGFLDFWIWISPGRSRPCREFEECTRPHGFAAW